MKILYHLPSRSRPEKFFSSLDNIISLSNSNDYTILCTLDLDDESMNNASVRSMLKLYENVLVVWGTSRTKVEAINRDIWMVSDWEILCQMSDDFVFIEKGFDEIIKQEFVNFKGLVHFPDGYLGSRLITYPIMHREYYSRFNYVFHPDFVSVFCDNEQMEVAQILGQYKYVDKNIMVHQHPMRTGKPYDDLLNRNESFYQVDRETYHRRKQINFGL